MSSDRESALAALPEGRRDPAGLFKELVALIARLRAPGGCPWDREQTHASVKPMTIEEAYEVAAAIDEGNDEELSGELGDLLLQVVFHAQVAAERGAFEIADVVEGVCLKMVRRHPHVFGGETATSSGEVLRNWEAIKAAERRYAGGEAPEASLLDSVKAGLPGVLEAFQITTKASRVGFDWPELQGVVDKLDEEVGELKSALRDPGEDAVRLRGELGDLLFTVVNLARRAGVDPESALKAANRKFRARFRFIEATLEAQGKSPDRSSLAELDALWNEAKAQERS